MYSSTYVCLCTWVLILYDTVYSAGLFGAIKDTGKWNCYRNMILRREDKCFSSYTNLWAELGYVNNLSLSTSHSQLNREQSFVHPDVSDWAASSNNPSASFSHSAFFSCWLQNSAPASGPHHVMHRLLRHHPLFMYPSLILPSENISLHHWGHANIRSIKSEKGWRKHQKPLLCNSKVELHFYPLS